MSAPVVQTERSLRTMTWLERSPRPPIDQRYGAIWAEKFGGVLETTTIATGIKVIRWDTQGQDEPEFEVYLLFPTNARRCTRLVSADPEWIEFLEQHAPEWLASAGPVGVMA